MQLLGITGTLSTCVDRTLTRRDLQRRFKGKACIKHPEPHHKNTLPLTTSLRWYIKIPERQAHQHPFRPYPRKANDVCPVGQEHHPGAAQSSAPELQGWAHPPHAPTILAPALALVQMPRKESLPKKFSDSLCFLTNLKYNNSCGIICTSRSSSPNQIMEVVRLKKNNASSAPNATFSFLKWEEKGGWT